MEHLLVPAGRSSCPATQKVLAIGVNGCRLIPVILRAGSRGRQAGGDGVPA